MHKRVSVVVWVVAAPLVGATLLVGMLCAPERSANLLGELLPPCYFRVLTGIRCPGCGGTHAVQALLRSEWYTAWHSNMFLWISLLLLAEEYVRYVLILFRGGENISSSRSYVVVLKIYAIATIAWFVLRNVWGV